MKTVFDGDIEIGLLLEHNVDIVKRDEKYRVYNDKDFNVFVTDSKRYADAVFREMYRSSRLPRMYHLTNGRMTQIKGNCLTCQ